MSLEKREALLAPQTYLLYTRQDKTTKTQGCKRESKLEIRQTTLHSSSLTTYERWRIIESRMKNSQKDCSVRCRQKWANKFIHRTLSLQNKDLAFTEGKKFKKLYDFLIKYCIISCLYKHNQHVVNRHLLKNVFLILEPKHSFAVQILFEV